MKRWMLSGLAVLSVTVLTICGCATTGKDASTQPATAMVTLSTEGALPPGSVIGGIDITLNLPPGVTAKADRTGATLAGVVVHSGKAQGAISVGKFTPAAGAASGQVRVAVIKADGFGTGEFATLNLDIAGAPPATTDFSTTAMSVTDINGRVINGLTASLALRVR